MDWVRSHPYAAFVGVAALLFAIGAFIVESRASVSPDAGGAWGGASSIPQNTLPLPGTALTSLENSRADILKQVQSGPPYSYTPISLPTSTQATPPSATAAGAFDFNTFIATIVRSDPASSVSRGASGSDAYSFIPQGLVATSTKGSERSASQQDLYEYANEVGSYIQSFDETHPGGARTLQDFNQDRSNPEKAAALQELASGYVQIARHLEGMDAPPSVKAAHDALAKSYRAIGENLVLLSNAAENDAFLKAVVTYDASADTFIRNYLSVANILLFQNVVFSPGDAGSVFSFTPGSF